MQKDFRREQNELQHDTHAPMRAHQTNRRTNAEENKEYQEHLADRNDCEGDREKDLAQGLESAKEAEHAQGAHNPSDSSGLVCEDEGDKGHADDEHVEPAPRVGYEWQKPRGKGDDNELNSKYDGKKEVDMVQSAPKVGK